LTAIKVTPEPSVSHTNLLYVLVEAVVVIEEVNVVLTERDSVLVTEVVMVDLRVLDAVERIVLEFVEDTVVVFEAESEDVNVDVWERDAVEVGVDFNVLVAEDDSL
jgi:hypothetical protein